MHQFYIILVSIILEVAYNVLNRKYFDNFSFINFIYVIKVYSILFLLIYFIKVYIILFLITYLFYLLFFMHLLICFELNDPEIEKHYKWTLKRLEVGMVLSLHPHSMCMYKTDNGSMFVCYKVAGESLHFFFACVICLLHRNHG